MPPLAAWEGVLQNLHKHAAQDTLYPTPEPPKVTSSDYLEVPVLPDLFSPGTRLVPPDGPRVSCPAL